MDMHIHTDSPLTKLPTAMHTMTVSISQLCTIRALIMRITETTLKTLITTLENTTTEDIMISLTLNHSSQDMRRSTTFTESSTILISLHTMQSMNQCLNIMLTATTMPTTSLVVTT